MKLQVDVDHYLLEVIHNMAEVNGLTIKFIINRALEEWIKNPVVTILKPKTLTYEPTFPDEIPDNEVLVAGDYGNEFKETNEKPWDVL